MVKLLKIVLLSGVANVEKQATLKGYNFLFVYAIHLDY